MYEAFSVIISSDVSRGSLGIPLAIPTQTNVRSGSKLNVGNYLMDEISRAFVYTYKGQNLLSYVKMSFG